MNFTDKKINITAYEPRRVCVGNIVSILTEKKNSLVKKECFTKA